MKYCVHGLGYQAECGEEAATTREGWPLCAEHGRLWDAWEAWHKKFEAKFPEEEEEEVVSV